MRGRLLRLSHAVLEAALAAAMAVTFSGCATPTDNVSGVVGRESAGSTVKVGAIVSLTGTYAGLGIPQKQAIELEVDRINAAGGVGGNRLEVVFEDDATDEAKAVAAASRLIDQENVVAIIGASGTGQSMAVRNEVVRAGIPQVSMAAGTVITSDFDEHVFQTAWSNTLVVPFVLDAMERRSIQRVALLTDNGGYGKDGSAVIRSELQQRPRGMRVVADETFNPGDTDITAQLTKVKNSGAQAVLVWNAGKEAVIIMKNADSLGMVSGPNAIPFFGASGQARSEFPEGGGEAAEGFTFGTGKSLVPSTWGPGSQAEKKMTDFSARYEEAYGEKPDIFAGHAYDAIHIVENALLRTGPNVTGPQLREAIEQTDGFVGFGGSFTFTRTDHNGLTADSLQLYRVKDGRWEPEL